MNRLKERSMRFAVILVCWVMAGLCLHFTAAVNAAGPVQQWHSHADPYWGIHIDYPDLWTLQSDPYRDFGVRIGSPDLVMDPLGRPLQGVHIAFFAYAAETYAPPTTFSEESETSLAGLRAQQWQGDDGAGAPVHVWQILRDGALTTVTVSAASQEAAANHATVLEQIMDSLRFTGPYRPHPLPAPPELARASASFPPLKHGFRTGPGWILAGYNTSSHQNGDLYALDLCAGNQCLVGEDVLAATDMELVWSGRGYGMPADSKDFHIWTFGRDNVGNFLCMSLGHMAITKPGLEVGEQVVQGTVIGELVLMPGTPHIHTGVWRSPDHCARWTREPIPYTGSFALDSVDYAPNEEHRGKAIVSTNTPFCPQLDCSDPSLTLAAPLTLVPPQPVSGDRVMVRFAIRNDGDETLTLPTLGVAVHAASCATWQNCSLRTDFPWQTNVTLAAGAVYTYEANRAFTTAEDGYLLRPLVQFANERWHETGEAQSLSITSALQITQDLTLWPSQPRAGEPVTATFTVVNRSTHPLSQLRLGVAVRGPNCESLDCPRTTDFSAVEDLSLPVDSKYTYTATQIFAETGVGYIAIAAEGDANTWRPLSTSQPLHFTVEPGEPTSLQVHGGSVSASAMITVSLGLHHLAPGIRVGAFHGDLAFDARVLQAEQCLVDDMGLYDMVQCQIKDDRIGIATVSVHGVAGDQILARVRFSAQGEPGASSLLTTTVHTLVADSGSIIEAASTGGRVEVHVPTVGDVTCDSSRAGDDALFMVQYDMAQRTSANTCPLPEGTILLSGCDTNGDGACNIIDGLLVLQCTIGMENVLCGGEKRPPGAQAATVKVGFGALSGVDRDGITLPVTATVQSGTLAALTITVPFDPDLVAAITCQTDPMNQFALALCYTTGATVRFTLIAPAGVQGRYPLANLTIKPYADVASLLLTAETSTAVDADGTIVAVEDETLLLTLPPSLYLPTLQK